MTIKKIILEGRHVRLEPLSPEHKAGLCDAIYDGELWNLYVTLVPPVSEIDNFFSDAESIFSNQQGLAFATIDKRTLKVAGSTRFMNADFSNKRIEIGFTLLGKSWQRTRINTEAKMLMLCHAFEVLNVNRVEFLTDYLNSTSRKAILRLGAKEEGILRNHMMMPDGRVRDSVIYSILKNEWPGVQQHLEYKLR